MSTFPTVIPSTRTHTPGTYPVSSYAATSGDETRLRHGNRIVGQQLTLSYDNITEAEWLLLRSHYLAHEPLRRSFNLPAEVLAGETADQFVETGYSWIYAGMPDVDDTQPDIHSVAITLERIPEPAPEGFLVISTPAAFVASPRTARLRYDRKILGQAAAFTTAGQVATIHKTTHCETTGQRAQLLYDRVIKGQAAAFGTTGQSASITYP
jgi:hypothetical protein